MHPFEKKRISKLPKVPSLLNDLSKVSFEPSREKTVLPEVASFFPHLKKAVAQKLSQKQALDSPLKIGVLFSGGPAPGGHNVIAGIISSFPSLTLVGFLGGALGLLEERYQILDPKLIFSQYLNTGGFDLLGSGRTKIETLEQQEKACQVVAKLKLDGLVIIGGDDSNTNAAVLSNLFIERGMKTVVVGVPKTIDGDLRADELLVPFGFDTACKIYSEMIGNIARDAKSSKKYYHVIKLMGRSASHIALECALTTKPNLTFIGEEKKSLREIVEEIVSLVQRRKKLGKSYGVILVPEGLLEFIPEVKALILLLNDQKELKEEEKKLFSSLPEKIQKQLLLDRDPHGNVRLSQIDTQDLLVQMAMEKLQDPKISFQSHFLGYEGRCGYPTLFDASYCFSLGKIAALAIRDQKTACLASIENLDEKIEDWRPSLIPLVSLMHLEKRSGQMKPVIRKALVDLKGKDFQQFASLRKSLEEEDLYEYPGPIQFCDE